MNQPSSFDYLFCIPYIGSIQKHLLPYHRVPTTRVTLDLLVTIELVGATTYDEIDRPKPFLSSTEILASKTPELFS